MYKIRAWLLLSTGKSGGEVSGKYEGNKSSTLATSLENHQSGGQDYCYHLLFEDICPKA